jgi:hypothetical protein
MLWKLLFTNRFGGSPKGAPHWPQFNTKLSFEEFKVKYGFDSSYIYSLATSLVTPFNSMQLYKITILPNKAA